MPTRPQGTVRRVEDHRDLSSEFKQLDLNSSPQSSPRSNHAGSPRSVPLVSQYNRRPLSQSLEDERARTGSPRSINFASAEDPYSEAVANFNLGRDETVLAGGLEDSHAIRRALARDQREDLVQPRRSRDINRDVINVRKSDDLSRPGSSRRSNEVTRTAIPAAAIPSRDGSLDWQRTQQSTGKSHIKRQSLEKPLPPPPVHPRPLRIFRSILRHSFPQITFRILRIEINSCEFPPAVLSIPLIFVPSCESTFPLYFTIHSFLHDTLQIEAHFFSAWSFFG